MSYLSMYATKILQKGSEEGEGATEEERAADEGGAPKEAVEVEKEILEGDAMEKDVKNQGETFW